MQQLSATLDEIAKSDAQTYIDAHTYIIVSIKT